jgi:hypothetical protein
MALLLRLSFVNWASSNPQTSPELCRGCWLPVRLLAQVPPHGFGENYDKRDKQSRTNEERPGGLGVITGHENCWKLD